MKILVTGVAGFIGYHVVKRLIERGDDVIGIDNINHYYDVRLKYARLKQIGIDNTYDVQCGIPMPSSLYTNFKFVKIDIADRNKLSLLFESEHFDYVIHLAAQAGVRYSIENPYAYVDSNLVGFVNVLEGCRNSGVKHLTYASSSSVYGGNTKTPFSEKDIVDSPVSLYAATKKANELLASSYSKLYGIPATGLRFFTVYGPWGRPDMAPILFTKAILSGTPIKVFNNGDMLRDFTYIDDIVEGVLKVNDIIPSENNDGRRHRVYNIGCSNPVKLMDFINGLEKTLGIEAKKIMLPMQAGDVYVTYADTTLLETEIGYKPKVMLTEGLMNFISWWKSDLNPLKK